MINYVSFSFLLFKLAEVLSTNFVKFQSMENNLGFLGYFNSEIVYGYRLDVQPFLIISVRNEFECLQHCLEDDNTCLTFNVLNNTSNEMMQCELLDADVFLNGRKLVEDDTSTHYGLQTKCWKKPCHNDASCIPDYEKNTFICKCILGCDGKFCQHIKSSCKAIYANGYRVNGVYLIQLPNKVIKHVFCNMEAGGWTAIQRRLDGSVDFYRSWQEYKEGFGYPSGEYWLGNEALHQLTRNSCELRIEMVYNGVAYYAYYSSFQITDEVSKYKLHINGFQGNVTDDFSVKHNDMLFSTWDDDNDHHNSRNCAAYYTAGWWYNACYDANLNGLWSSTAYDKGIVWRSLNMIGVKSLDYVSMEIKCGV